MDAIKLLSRIDAFCKDHDVSATAFGIRAINDGKLVPRLRAGKTITLKTLERVNAALSEKPRHRASTAKVRGGNAGVAA